MGSVRGKRKTGIQGILWKNYVFMVLISSILILIPFVLILFFSEAYRDDLVVERYCADTLLKEYYESGIDVEKTSAPREILKKFQKTETFSAIIRNHGGVQIVSNELKVQSLGGLSLLEQKSFSMKEWTKMLQSFSFPQDGYSFSVAYQEEIGWIVVEFPVSVVFVVFLGSNSDSVDFPLMILTMFGILLLYFILLGISAVIYAGRTAKSLIWPIQDLCSDMKQFQEEKEEFPKIQENDRFAVGAYRKGRIIKKREKQKKWTWDTPVPRELLELRADFIQMKEEIFTKEREKEQMFENRKRLIRDISHDLKNPLAGILGYVELMQKNEFSEEEKEKYLSVIYQNSVRANQLIQSLFEYSKLDSADFKLNLKQEDLCELLRLKLVEFFPLFEEKGFLLEAGIPEKEVDLMVDAGIFGRIFDNLFENTLRYNQAGTVVRVGLMEKADGKICIYVEDNGIGMDAEFAEHAFDVFSREDDARNSKNGGSGLGLAIVHRIVRLHGGELTLTSKKGEGCSFLIEWRKELRNLR